MLDAGVVHEDVDGTEFRFGGSDEGGDFFCLAHIGTVIRNFNTMLVADFGAEDFDFNRIAKTVEHDMGSLLSEGSGDT